MLAMKPGVLIERVDASRVPPVVLRTDVAAFIGIAQRGPLDMPVPIESMRQFSAHFGDFIGGGYLAYAVRGFFENGGRRCWVVRVAQREFADSSDGLADGGEAMAAGARAAAIDINDTLGRRALRITASSPGSWGNTLSLEWSASGQTITSSLPVDSTPQASGVVSTAGFVPDELVRIEQGAIVAYRVIASVDAMQRKLYWVHPDTQVQRDTDQALADFDGAQPLRIVRIAYALTVRERGRVVASYRDLHLVPAHPRYLCLVLRPPAYWTAALGQSVLDPGAFAAVSSGAARDDSSVRALPRAPEPIVALRADVPLRGAIPQPLDVPFDASQSLAGGADGVALLAPEDFIGEPWEPTDSDFTRARKSRGVQALALIDEIALVAMPDLLIRPAPEPDYLPVTPPRRDPCVTCPAPPTPRRTVQPAEAVEQPPAFTPAQIARTQSALIDLCIASGDRFAVIGLPFDIATASERSRNDAIAWRAQFDARCAALAAPWIIVGDPSPAAGGAAGALAPNFSLNGPPSGSATRLIPACGHVLGAIARTDLASGVQQAPGNAELNGVIGTVRSVDDELHAEWNDAGIDVLRAEFGRNPLLGGARTLAYDPQWRYVNVVRLMLTIKKAADIALRWVVFEPNNEALRATVRSTLLAILRLFFARGAFAGETEETSFFVRCDEALNPPAARDAGQLVALVGFAPAAPAEFILLRVGRQFDTPAVSLFGATSETQA
jgi:hypothetical protein